MKILLFKPYRCLRENPRRPSPRIKTMELWDIVGRSRAQRRSRKDTLLEDLALASPAMNLRKADTIHSDFPIAPLSPQASSLKTGASS